MNNIINNQRYKALKSKKGEDYYDLAQCYESVNQFGNPNPYFSNFRRLYWYFKAGRKGYAEAYNNIGFIIEHEMINVRQKEIRALMFYKLSYELGSVLGKENYLLMIKNKNI